jgi:hypothetical protein
MSDSLRDDQSKLIKNNHYPNKIVRNTSSHSGVLTNARTLENLIEFPFRLGLNIIIILIVISLQFAWIGFLFGSVLGVVLLLIFFPAGFLLPLGLLRLMVELWP